MDIKPNLNTCSLSDFYYYGLLIKSYPVSKNIKNEYNEALEGKVQDILYDTEDCKKLSNRNINISISILKQYKTKDFSEKLAISRILKELNDVVEERLKTISDE
jgi:hypothetical protein